MLGFFGLCQRFLEPLDPLAVSPIRPRYIARDPAGTCADNAATESLFGMLKLERVNGRQYRTRSEARTDVFDYIERFHNPRKIRKIERLRKEEVGLPNRP